MIKKEYFQELFPKVKEEEIDTLGPKDKPAVLLIRPDKFVDFVKTKLMEKGVRKEEIIIMPVSYADYYRKPFIIGREAEKKWRICLMRLALLNLGEWMSFL